MLNKKLMVLTIFLVGLLAVSTVSAEDNSTGDFSANQISAVEDNSTVGNLNDDEFNLENDDGITVEGDWIDATEAYECLNEFRTTKGVWFWASDNENIIYYNTNEENQLQPLEIDEGLEDVAKIRAKEIVLHFEHERPDGSEIHSLYLNISGYDYIGENLAFSYFTGKDATEAWKESYMMSDGQGHRRSMLDPVFNRVGIAGFLDSSGVPFWVQAFGYDGIPAKQTQTNIIYDDSKASFADLCELIAANDSIQFVQDFEFKNESGFTNGILIDKSITIDGCGHTIDGKKLTAIFNITSANVILKNIKFMNAYVDYANGGAIRTTADLTLINCSFSDNFAYYGSAIYSTDASLSITDCSFNDNYAVKGAVFVENGNALINNCIFNNNSAILYGGALSPSNTELTIANSTFTNNSAYVRGGAIFSLRSKLSVMNSSFIANELNADGMACGGALCAEDSNISLTDCDFSKNRMNSYFKLAYGGALYLIDGVFSIKTCNFTDNSAMNFGGAVCLVNNNGTLLECDFIGNSVYKGSYSSSGGAIYGSAGNVTVSKCDFSTNTADNGASIGLEDIELSIDECCFLDTGIGDNGAAVFSYDVNLTVSDCIFSNCTCRFNGGAIFLRGGKISLSDSLFENGAAAYGAFVRLENAQISITNNNFTNGTAKNVYDAYGGAMYLTNCYGFVEHSNFENNSVYSEQFTTRGGAILSEYGDVSFNGCNFSNNIVDNGAAISSEKGNISISDSHFKSNFADNRGGALAFDTCNASILNSYFSDCRSSDGGAIYSYCTNLSVSQSDFTNNSAYWGGAVYSHVSNATVYGSVFTCNVADWTGGALYSCNAVNSTFTENSADTAAAIYGENNTASDCRFIKNVAYNEGPTFEVTCIDCEFIQNRIIQKVILDGPYQESEYYQGDVLYVWVYNQMSFELLSNVTLTIGIYENGSIVDKFNFSSNDGWNVSLGEGVYHAMIFIENPDFEADAINITLNVTERQVPDVCLVVGNDTYLNPTVVNLSSSAEGSVEIYLDDFYIDYFETTANEDKQIVYYAIAAGKHTIKAVLTPTDSKISPVSIINEFEIYKKPTQISLEVKNTTDEESVMINFTASENGVVVVKLNGVDVDNYYVNSNVETQIYLGFLNPGEYNVLLTLTVNENYIDSNASKTFKVFDEIKQDEITISENSSNLVVTLPSDATGTVTLTINGQNYTFDVSGGVAEVKLPELADGSYSYTITYSGDDKYSSFVSSDVMVVNNTNPDPEPALIIPDVSIPSLDGALSVGYVIVSVPGDVAGNVVLSIDGKDYVFDVYDGKANVTLSDLANGDYDYSINYYPQSKYANFTDSGLLKVNKTGGSSDNKPVPEIVVPPLDEPSADGSVKVSLPSDATGEVTLTINGKTYSFPVENGVANVVIPDLGDGNYPYTITYSGDDKYSSFTNSGTLTKETPKVNPVIAASNVKVTYSAGSYYTIKVNGTDGKPADGAQIVITVNGKLFKTLTTTNGVAKFKITNVPGTYKMNITALGKSLSRTLTVKHLLTLKSVTVKKSAKKLVLTATLGKINNKYLKNKKITFKFNGKKYTAKTNKKGVAKVTIKSNILKKLKVGKKVTYQATYSKDSVKKTSKIKK